MSRSNYDPVMEAERVVRFYDPRPRHPAYRYQMDQMEQRAVQYRGRWRTVGLIVAFVAFAIGAFEFTPENQYVGFGVWGVAIIIALIFELIGQHVYRKRSPW